MTGNMETPFSRPSYFGILQMSTKYYLAKYDLSMVAAKEVF